MTSAKIIENGSLLSKWNQLFHTLKIPKIKSFNSQFAYCIRYKQQPANKKDQRSCIIERKKTGKTEKVFISCSAGDDFGEI